MWFRIAHYYSLPPQLFHQWTGTGWDEDGFRGPYNRSPPPIGAVSNPAQSFAKEVLKQSVYQIFHYSNNSYLPHCSGSGQECGGTMTDPEAERPISSSDWLFNQCRIFNVSH